MALKTFVDDESLTASDVRTYLVNTLFARKTASESVADSTTFQNDDDLTLDVAANSRYETTLVLRYDGASDRDLKVQLSMPSGATAAMRWTRLGTLAGGVTTVVSDEWDGAAFSVGALGSGTTVAAVARGLIHIGATAGTLRVQWAQLVSGATATRLLANSYICLRRVI